MKTTSYYIKSLVLMLLMTAESASLTYFIVHYIRVGDYFTPSVENLIYIGVSMLLLAYTYSLSIGSWGDWEQYVIVPLPISMGIFLITFNFIPGLSPLVALASYALITYGVFIATHIESQMAKFNPRIILRFSLRGIFMVFSILAAFLVFVYSEGNQLDFGEKIGQLASSQVNKILQPKPGEGGKSLIDFFGGKTIPSDPELYGQLGGLNVNNSSMIGNLGALDLDLGESVASEINKVIAPYKRFIAPLIALIIFGLMQFVSYVVTIVYSATIDLVFGLCKKSGLYNIKLTPIVKESLTFKDVDNRQDQQETPQG